MSLLLAEETLSLVMSYDDTVQWDSAVAVAHATRTTFAAGWTERTALRERVRAHEHMLAHSRTSTRSCLTTHERAATLC
eukprot:4598533-Pleurochrysis_carterae.AAC.1